jgi:hypothetical protein
MKLLSLTLEIRYKNNIQLIEVNDPRQKFIESITDIKVLPPPELSQGVQHNDIKTKSFVAAEPSRLAIVCEQDNEDKAQERILNILKEAYARFKYKDAQIARVGVKSIWVETWNNNFTSLVKAYKEKFYQQNELLTESDDVAVNLTLKDDGCKVNFVSGAMKPEQGKTFVIFKEIELPHDFIFTLVDKYDEGGIIENKYTSIKEFFLNSTNYGRLKTNQVTELLRR